MARSFVESLDGILDEFCYIGREFRRQTAYGVAHVFFDEGGSDADGDGQMTESVEELLALGFVSIDYLGSQFLTEKSETLIFCEERELERRVMAEKTEVQTARGYEDRGCAAGDEFGGIFALDVIEDQQAAFL